MLEKYKASGQMGGMTPGAVVVIGAAMVVAGGVYQALVHYIPFIYILFVVTCAYAFAGFWVVRRVLTWTHCRNAGVGAVMAGVGALLGVAATHYIEFALTVKELPPVSFLGEFMQFKAETGWNIGRGASQSQSGSGMLSGWAVYVIWGGEALVVLLGALMGAAACAGSPYCEQCSVWADKLVAKFRVEQPAEAAVARVEQAVQARDLVVTGGGAAMPAALLYELHECPACNGVKTVEVKFEQTVEKKKGKPERSEKTLHEHVLLTAGEAEELLAMERAGALQPAAVS